MTIDQPEAESVGTSPPVAFVEGRMNCATAVAVMDMQASGTGSSEARGFGVFTDFTSTYGAAGKVVHVHGRVSQPVRRGSASKSL